VSKILAIALAQEGITIENVLLGDWRKDAKLLSSSEQNELRQAMGALDGAAGHTG
jgi:hypothetical protein